MGFVPAVVFDFCNKSFPVGKKCCVVVTSSESYPNHRYPPLIHLRFPTQTSMRQPMLILTILSLLGSSGYLAFPREHCSPAHLRTDVAGLLVLMAVVAGNLAEIIVKLRVDTIFWSFTCGNMCTKSICGSIRYVFVLLVVQLLLLSCFTVLAVTALDLPLPLPAPLDLPPPVRFALDAGVGTTAS